MARGGGEVDAVGGVAAILGPRGLRSQVVAPNHIAGGRDPVEFDAVARVAADQVAGGRRWATDQVGGPGDPHAVAAVALGGDAVGAQADEVPFDDVVVTEHFQAMAGGALEPSDGQPAHGALAAPKRQPGDVVRSAVAVQPDLEHGIVARGQSVRAGTALGVAVQDDRIGHRRQSGQRRDEVRARTGDGELDLVGAIGDGGIGLEKSLAQGTGAAVVGIDDREGGGRHRAARRHHWTEFGRVAVRIGRRGGDVTAGQPEGQRHREAGVAAGVGRHVGRAQVELALPVASRIEQGGGEEIEGEGRAGRRVQIARDDHATARVGGVRKNREVLQSVGPGVGVARVVGGDAGRAEVNAEIGVGEDGIAPEGVVRVGHRRGDADTIRAVEGNAVAGPA